MSYSHGFASGTDVPIEHLDFGYINNCRNASYMEKIVKILRSNEEGSYPDLLKCAETKLLELNPASKLLIQSQSVRNTRDLPQEDYQKISQDLQQWEEQVCGEDQELRTASGSLVNGDQHLPPVRQAGAISKEQCEGVSGRSGGGGRSGKVRRFKDWDKFDVEEECARVDQEECARMDQECAEVGSGRGKKEEPSGNGSADSKVFHRSSSMTEKEKQKMARMEKDKGNEAFKAGDFREALSYYSRSLQLHKTVPTRNNRALTYIRLDKYHDAISDTNLILKLEPDNTKALFRRGLAHVKLKAWSEAESSLEHLLQVDPGNKKARELLAEARQGTRDATHKASHGGRRVLIEETEGGEETSGDSRSTSPTLQQAMPTSDTPSPYIQQVIMEPVEQKVAPPHEVTTCHGGETTPQSQSDEATPHNDDTMPHSEDAPPHSEESILDHSREDTPSHPMVQVAADPVPMPTNVSELKDVGNDYFRRGQFGDASLQYTGAMEELARVSEGDEHNVSMATLLNNKAMCELKNGNPRQCVLDCSKSLDLHPINVKALVRRARAYEELEKYKLAYVDNLCALSLDRSLENVYAANNRLVRQLQELDGLEWRQKLPQHSHHHTITQALYSHASPSHNATPSSTQTPISAAVSSDNLAAPSNDLEVPSDSSVTPSQDLPPSTSVIPPITTTSPLSQTKLTQSTTHTTPTATPTPAMPTPVYPTKMEVYEKSRAKGNNYIQKGQYLEAMHCYSACIEALPDQVAGYTNRALCHLRLSSFALAENDCQRALGLESGNVKALYRRAMARKNLQNYSGSVKDLKKLLEIDGRNSAASTELDEVKKLWEKQLRELQASLQTPPEGSKGTKDAQKEKKGSDKERKADADKEKLSKILAAAQSSLEKLKENVQRPQPSSKPPSLSRSRNSSQRQPSSSHTPDSTPSSTGKKGKRRKVMVEEVNGKTSPGLHRLTSQPTPQENRPTNKKPEISEDQKNSSMEKEQARVLTKEMMSLAQGENTGLETERVQKALAEKEKELESKRASGSKEKRTEEEKQVKESMTGKSNGKKNKTKQEPLLEKREKLSTPDGAKVRLKENSKVEMPAKVKKQVQSEEDLAKTSPEHSGNKTDVFLSTPYEFMQLWNSVPRRSVSHTSSSVSYAAILRRIPPDKMPELITNKLEGHMLSAMLAALSRELLPHSEYELCAGILSNLLKVARFSTVIMFLEEKEKKELRHILATLLEAGSITDSFKEELARKYDV